MINHLTDLQQKQLIEHRDKWLAIGWASGAADMATVIPVITDMYRQLGKDKPLFIHCRSPFEANLFIHILKHWKKAVASAETTYGDELRHNLQMALSKADLPQADIWTKLNYELRENTRTAAGTPLDDGLKAFVRKNLPHPGMTDTVLADFMLLLYNSFAAPIMEAIAEHMPPNQEIVSSTLHDQFRSLITGLADIYRNPELFGLWNSIVNGTAEARLERHNMDASKRVVSLHSILDLMAALDNKVRDRIGYDTARHIDSTLREEGDGHVNQINDALEGGNANLNQQLSNLLDWTRLEQALSTNGIPAVYVLIAAYLEACLNSHAINAGVGHNIQSDIPIGRAGNNDGMNESLHVEISDDTRREIAARLRSALASAINVVDVKSAIDGYMDDSLGHDMRRDLENAMDAAGVSDDVMDIHDRLRTTFAHITLDGITAYLRRQPMEYTSTWLWGSLDAYWIAYYLFAETYINPNIYQPEHSKLLHQWATLAEHCGYWYAFENVCLVCDRPNHLHFDENNRLHSGDSPALGFTDGMDLYYWHGFAVDEDVIMHPEKITIVMIDQQPNAEVRRIMLERYGWARYLQDSGASLIHSDSFGDLYKKDMGRDLEPLLMVHVICPSTGRRYWLGVPEHNELTGRPMDTAHAACAWTFSLRPEQYKPNFES